MGDELRPEYDLARLLKEGVRGKYAEGYHAGINLVLLDGDTQNAIQVPTSAPVTPKKFLTNQGDNTLSKRLEKILPLTQDFACLVGYFFISGFFRLYPALESVKKIRILIGLKNEQVVQGLLRIANDDAEEGAGPPPISRWSRCCTH